MSADVLPERFVVGSIAEGLGRRLVSQLTHEVIHAQHTLCYSPVSDFLGISVWSSHFCFSWARGRV